MSSRIRVCDAADNQEQLRCLWWDAGHAQAYTPTVRLSLLPNLPLTHSLQSLTRQTASQHTNAVTGVKRLVSESDYARTSCIIRFLAVSFQGVIKWIQEDILLLLPLTIRVNKNVKKSASTGHTLVKSSCESSLLPATYLT